jgi:hypothetical protein
VNRRGEPVHTVPSRRRNLVTVGVLLGVVALGLAAGRWITTAAPFTDVPPGSAVVLAGPGPGDGVVVGVPLRRLLGEPDAPEVARLTLSSASVLGLDPDAAVGVEVVVCMPAGAPPEGVVDGAVAPDLLCAGEARRVSGARVTADDLVVLVLPALPAEAEVCLDGLLLRFRDGIRTGDQRVALDVCVTPAA